MSLDLLSNGSDSDGGLSAPDITVENSSQYVDLQLKKILLNRYQKIDEVRHQTRLLAQQGQMSEFDREELIGDFVRDWIRSFDQLLKSKSIPEGQPTLYDYPVGPGHVFVPPPHDILKAVEILSDEPPEPQPVPMNGLNSILKKPYPGAEWEIYVRASELPDDDRIQDPRPRRDRKHITVRNSIPIPEQILMDAVSLGWEFLDEIGIGYQKTTERSVANYSEGFKRSRLYDDWADSVKRGTPDDFVICVTASSRTGVSGTGKTTLQTTLAEHTDLSPGGFDAEDTASLDAGELAYEKQPEADQKTTLVFDEAQGTPGTQGLDSRRAMKDEVIDAINSILASRDDQHTIIIGAQQFSTLDPRIYPIVDAWLLIRKGPNSPKGPSGTYYKVHVDDYDLNSASIETPAVEDFSWEPLPEDNENYAHLEKLKQLAKTQQYAQEKEDEEDELSRETIIKMTQWARDIGLTAEEIKKKADWFPYSEEWVYRYTESPDGEKADD